MTALRIIIGCESSAAFTVLVLGERGMIDGCNGVYLSEYEAEGSLWAPLPDGYMLAFEAET